MLLYHYIFEVRNQIFFYNGLTTAPWSVFLFVCVHAHMYLVSILLFTDIVFLPMNEVVRLFFCIFSFPWLIISLTHVTRCSTLISEHKSIEKLCEKFWVGRKNRTLSQDFSNGVMLFVAPFLFQFEFSALNATFVQKSSTFIVISCINSYINRK